MEIELSIGKVATVKRMGARSQARVFDLLAKIADEPEFRETFAKFSGGEKIESSGFSEILKVFGIICNKKWDEVEKIALCVSDLTPEDFSDDETGVGIDDLFAIMIAAFHVNDFGKLLERLGNALAPSASQADGAKSQENTNPLNSTSLINSDGPTDGTSPTLKRSISGVL